MDIKVLQLFATSKKGLYSIYDRESTQTGNFIFAFVRPIGGEFPEELYLKAVHAGQEETITLIHMPDHFYKAEVSGIGIFYFVVDYSRSNACLESEDGIVKLSVLTPVNEDFFEQACREHHFFFVGD